MAVDIDPTDGTPRSKRQRRLATDTTTSAVLPQGDDGPPPLLTLPPPSSLPLPPTFPGVGVHGVDLVKDEEPDDEGYYNFVVSSPHSIVNMNHFSWKLL